MKPAHLGGSLTAARLRRALSTTILTATLAGGAATASLAASASTSMPADTVTPSGSVPNTYGTSPSTSLLLDAANHLLFEYQGGTGNCPFFVAFDTARLSKVQTQPCDPQAGAEQINSTNPAGGPLPPDATVDPIDHLIIGFKQVLSAPGSVLGTSGSHLDFISETTLRRQLTLTLPTSIPEANIVGVSWYGPKDELLVTSTFGEYSAGIPVAPGVAVSAYHVPDILQTKTLTPLWSVLSAGSCADGLDPSYFTAAAYHAGNEAAVYLPCQFVHGTAASLGVQVDGVVKLLLGAKDSTGSPCPAQANGECPTGATSSAAAPGWVADFYFDPVSDRGFMPLSLNGEATALVYDGHAGTFIGKIDLGATTAAGSSTLGAIVGLDQSTGRIYAVDPGGLTLVDTRRAQIAPGTTLSQYANNTVSGSSVVIPADATHPYPRLVVSDFKNDAVSTFVVYADTIAVAQDPKSTDVDKNTYSGTVASGATITKSSVGTARGYGFHFDWVGGPQGTVDNTGGNFTTITGLPFGAGNRDLLAASINYVTQQNGSQDGAASALTDANGTTAYDYRQCSNSATFGNCASVVSPNFCPQQGFGQQCVPPPPLPAPPDSSSTQDWAFPTATCSQPGNKDNATGEVQGFQANGDPNSTLNAQTQNAAKAHVDCTGGAIKSTTGPLVPGGTTSDAILRSWSSDAGYQPGGGSVTISSASTSAHVLPATDKTPAESVVDTSVKGLGIDLGSSGTISIGEIDHHEVALADGVAGSALTTNTVSITDVKILSANGPFSCTTNCTQQQVLDAINTNFPYLAHAMSPSPDAPFGLAADNTSPKGSPGGYQAQVAANQAEQFGDKQYNGMSTEEATMLPAFRLVIYAENDGTPNLSRFVMDFAGGQVDAETGLQVLNGFDGGGDDNLLPVPIAQAATQAGVPMGPIDNGAGTPPGGTSGGAKPNGPGGALGVVMGTFSGLAWLGRSPGAAMQMAAFLVLLGLPIVLMRRRWTWSVVNPEGESQ